jgi:hypothetical protein
MIGAAHGQVALRNIRRNAIEAVKKLEKGTTPISEDESKSLQVSQFLGPPLLSRQPPCPCPPRAMPLCNLSLSRQRQQKRGASKQRDIARSPTEAMPSVPLLFAVVARLCRMRCRRRRTSASRSSTIWLRPRRRS